MIAGACSADPIRIATYNAALSRKGPGLLLRDILKGKDKQIQSVISVLNAANPDVLLLTNIDWDYDLVALNALSDALAEPYPYQYAPQPNTGIPTGIDIDRNDRLGEARDAQGYGRFSGDGGMALLSRFPINHVTAQNFGAELWSAQPETSMKSTDTGWDIQRLSTSGHWVVPIDTSSGTLQILAFAATPPVFDGPEDRNGRRNHDEIAVWHRWLDTEPETPVVVVGLANLDPVDGEGIHSVINALVLHPRLQDAEPSSAGGLAARNAEHGGDPALDTVDLSDPRPGNLRLSYVLPSREFQIVEAGVVWPSDADPSLLLNAETAGRHRLVWVDVSMD